MLEKIAAAKRAEVESEMRALSMRRAIELASAAPAPHPFASALVAAPAPAIIAEIGGRAARAGATPADEMARRLEEAGAAALSVLTDERFLQGSQSDLRLARAASSLPLLRKDFILEEYQIYRSRALGADALFLLARLVPVRVLTTLVGVARSMHMAALVEVRDADEIERAVGSGTDLLLLNARGGAEGEPPIETALRLAGLAPAGTITITAGAVETAADLARLGAAGYRAALLGERLMRELDPAEALRRLRAGEIS